MPQLHQFTQAAPIDVRFRTTKVGGQPIRIADEDTVVHTRKYTPMVVAVLPIVAVIAIMLFSVAL